MAKQPTVTLDMLPWKVGDLSIYLWQQALKAAYDVQYPMRYRLQNLYRDIMIDLHLTSVAQKRVLNLQNKRIRFNTGTDKPNLLIDDLIEKTSIVSEILRYQAETNLFGFTLLWIDISLPGKQKPTLKLVDRRHVVPEKGVYMYRLGDMTGTSYLDPLYTPWTLQLGDTDNLGLLFKCAPWVIYKRGDISDWATFNEIFGMPFRKATYTRGDTKAKEELEEAMQMQASQSWVVHPEGTNITTEASGSSNSSSKDSFKEFAEFANSEMSKAILGNTMTTDAEGGNYKGEVHEDSQDDVFAADEIAAMELLNGQFYQLLEMHGYNPAGGRFEFVYDDTLELDKEVTVVKEITAMVDVDQDYVRERFGVPAPKPGTIPANRVNAIPMPTVGDVKQSLAERVGSFFA